MRDSGGGAQVGKRRLMDQDSGCAADRGILMGPAGGFITISQPGGQLSSRKRACCRDNCTLWEQSY